VKEIHLRLFLNRCKSIKRSETFFSDVIIVNIKEGISYKELIMLF